MKNTYAYLKQEVTFINRLLERPVSQFTPISIKEDTFSVGHLMLDKSSQGYQLLEQVSESGGCEYWSAVLTATEMAEYLTGLKAGVALAQVLIRKKVEFL